MSPNKLRVGVIGAGRMGKLRSEILAHRVPSAVRVAITDVNLEAANVVGSEYGFAKVAKDPNEILSNAEIDAVVICSSTDTHAELIKNAAASGKHIFCEKPIHQNLREIDEALAAVDRSGVKLQIGFNRRFDASFARVRQAVAGGEIGTPYLLHIVSRDPAPPPIDYVKSSGGIFLDMAIHDFDMARFLIGDEVEEVHTMAAVRVDSRIGDVGDLDTAVTLLRFRGGTIGTIDNCRQAVYGYDQRAEILGSAGSISTANVFPNEATISTAQNVRRDLPLNFFMDRYTASFATEMQAFIEAVLEDKPTLVTGVDGRIPVVMGIAARMSHDQKRPVKLTEVT